MLKNLAEAARLCELETGSACSVSDLDVEAPSCKGLPEYGSCAYGINSSNGSEAFVRLDNDFGLVVNPRGRFCVETDYPGGKCAKYGLTGPRSGRGGMGDKKVSGASLTAHSAYALDSTSN